jgi:hypothetical protein
VPINDTMTDRVDDARSDPAQPDESQLPASLRGQIGMATTIQGHNVVATTIQGRDDTATTIVSTVCSQPILAQQALSATINTAQKNPHSMDDTHASAVT